MRAAPVFDGGGHRQAQVGKQQRQHIGAAEGKGKAHEVEKHHSTQVYERGKQAVVVVATALCQAYARIKMVKHAEL